MHSKFYFIYFTVFVNIMAFSLVFPLLPIYAREFNASGLQIGMLAASMAVMQLIFSPLWGKISDRIGRKPTIMIGVAGLSVGFVLFGLANSLFFLFAARIFQGFFSGASLPSARAYVADLTSKEERIKAMSRIGAALALGIIMGPFIGGYLADYGGLSFPFFVSSGIAVINFILVWLFLPESLKQKSKKIVLREAFIDFGVLKKLLRGPVAPLLVLAFLWSFGMANNQVALPLLGIDKFGAGARDMGMLFGVMGAAAFITQIFLVAFISQKIGERRTIITGLLLVAIVYMFVPFMPYFNMLIGILVFSTIGSAIARPVITALVSEETHAGQGVTMGIMTSVESIGRIIGPVLAGILFDINYSLPFFFGSIVIALTIVFVTLKFNFLSRQHKHPIVV